MKTHTITTYTIDEHPDKPAVLEWVRNNWHDLYDWHDENAESLRAFAAWFGFKVNFEVSTCSYSFAKIQCEGDQCKLSGMRLWKWLNNNGFFKFGDCQFTGFHMDEVLLDQLKEFHNKPIDCTLPELLSECANNWVQTYIKDWEYCYSDEGLTEFLVGNEYNFLESGEYYN